MTLKHSLAPKAIAAALALVAAPAAACDGPALLVKVAGLKNRSAEVRVRAFGGNPKSYFDRKHVSAFVYKRPPAAGPVEYCLPVKPGVYAVDVRQDVNGDTKTSAVDGVGISGNPKMTMLDVILKRRPPASQVQVRVGQSVAVVPVTVQYRG